MFFFISYLLSIDAYESETLGRYVNDERNDPNCMMKKVELNGNPHLCMYAKRSIKEGEELTYSYDADNLPWRQVSFALLCNFSISFIFHLCLIHLN